MSTEQSERIRAALARAKTSREPSQSPTLEQADEAKPPQQEVAETPAKPERVAVKVESELSSLRSLGPGETHWLDQLEGAELAEQEPPEVETTLPLVAARNEDRLKDLRNFAAPEANSPRISTTRVVAGGENSRGRVLRIVLVAAGVMVVAGLSLFFLKDRWRPETKPDVAGAPLLQMQVESQGNGIISIRWNPQSQIVTQAKEGRLVILERDQQPRTVALGPDELKIGHLFYQSPAESAEFRLEIIAPSGAVTKESVLALSSGKAAEPAAGPPVAPTVSDPKMAVINEGSQIAPSADAKPERTRIENAQETRPASRPPVRSFTPPPSQTKTPETRADLLEPPPQVNSGSAAPPPVSLPDAAARIPAPQFKEPPVPAPTAPQQTASQSKQLKSGGMLDPPKLIKRVAPVYPPAAQAAHLQGLVRFTATIAKDGSIHDIHVVSGPALLIQSATEAVKKWVYKPMLLDGQPTEVVTQIDVNFTLGQ